MAGEVSADIGKRLEDLGKYFSQGYYDKSLVGEWQLIRQNTFLEEFNESTQSILLGLFLAALMKIRNRKFKSTWDTITVTGILENDHEGYFKLVEAGDIKEKYDGEFLENAKKNKDKKHLFLYVSDGETIDEGEELGTHKNIFVKKFSPKEHTPDHIADYLFEPYSLKWNIDPPGLDDGQRKSINALEKIDYIPTSKFEEVARKFSSGRGKGLFIYGEGGSGKSALANALARRLLWEGRIYAPIWIRLDNGELLKKISRDKRKTESDDLKKYITDLILKNQISFNERPYLFVFDNLELKSDNIKIILSAIMNIFAGNNQFIIITSRIDCADAALKSKLKLTTVKPPEMQEDGIAQFVLDVSNDNEECQRKIKAVIHTNEYHEFINVLYQNFGTSPELIRHIVFLLSEMSIVEATNVARHYGQTEGDMQKKAVEIYKPVFSLLSHQSKLVFFAIMNTDDYDKPIDKRVILENANEIYETTWLKDTALEESLRELRQSCLIYTTEENNATKYAIKSHVHILFMFNRELDGGKIPETDDSYRELVVAARRKLVLALEHDMPPETVNDIIERGKEKALTEETTEEEFSLDDVFLFPAAMYSSSRETLDILIQNGCDINREDEDGVIPFLSAVANNPNPQIINWFLDKEADIHAMYEGLNALHLAAMYNPNPEILRLLIKNGFDPELVSVEGIDAFCYAAKQNPNTAMLDFFAEQPGFNINKSYYVKSDLKTVVKKINTYDNPEVVISDDSFNFLKWADRVLSDDESKIEQVCLPIHFAAHNKNIDILKWFFLHKARIEKDSQGELLFNTIARFRSDPEFLDLFKKNKIDIHEKDAYGQNAFHCAAYQNGSIGIFDWLYRHKVDINLKNNEDETPFLIAVKYNHHPEVLSWFIKQRKSKIFDDWMINDYFGVALVENKEAKMLQWFLDNGADIDYQDGDGNTLLHLAAQYGEHYENIQWLIDHGLQINARNNEGKTAQYYIKKRKLGKK